ncbi:MAG: hypothetical protein V1799_05365 [bacterium]
MRTVATIALIFLLFTTQLRAQTIIDSIDVLQKSAIKVFLDCDFCDENYIRTEITFVNYVRDRKEADVHIMVTLMSTGSEGTEYTFTLYGQGTFLGKNDTLLYISNKTDTPDMSRKGLVRVLKIGLMRYSMHTPLADYFSVSYNRPTASSRVTDKWNYWVFSISLNSNINGESHSNSENYSGSLSASRTTEDWKIRLSMSGNYSANNYEFEIDENTVIKSTFISRSQYINGSVVKSLGDNFSAGLFGSAYSSTYSNMDLSVDLQPGVEYDFFPYSESTRRMLTLTYRAGISSNNYVDTTIYLKKSEILYRHSLSLALSLQQPWGQSSVSLNGSQYLHDLSKNSFSIYSSLSIRLFEGLSVRLYGGYSAIHDQVTLPKRELTVEDVYQRQRQLETSYSFWGSVGFSYTFGSIFNNIVNPRFGGGGGGVYYY